MLVLALNELSDLADKQTNKQINMQKIIWRCSNIRAGLKIIEKAANVQRNLWKVSAEELIEITYITKLQECLSPLKQNKDKEIRVVQESFTGQYTYAVQLDDGADCGKDENANIYSNDYSFSWQDLEDFFSPIKVHIIIIK